MKRTSYTVTLLTLALSLVVTGSAAAERGDDANRPSKNGKASATLDGVDVSLEFGRPNVNGRKVWGGIVPYGEVWRTGANEATTITFGADVKIEGQPLAAGTYGLFTKPGEGEWTIIFNKTAEQWGSFNYSATEDALRVTVTPKSADNEESMNFYFYESWVVLHWEKLLVSFQVQNAG